MNPSDKVRLERLIESSYSNTVGILVMKNSKVAYEKYFNGYDAATFVHVASVTKSIFSALIGIAIEKGYITSINQKILDFFPEYVIDENETTLQKIRIKDMLTMTAPYKYEVEPYEEFFASENWVIKALSLMGGEDQIGKFNYSAIVGTHILSGILTKVTGQSVFDFATENLFSPLGIDPGEHVILHDKEEQIAFFQENERKGWVTDPQGINTAGFGLTLTAQDMAKIGELYLREGLWQDKDIVPKWWIDESTKEHSQWQMISYGYLWWIIDEKEQCYAAMGDGGNVIYVNRKKDIVIAITSTFVPTAEDRIELIKECIEPMFMD